MSRLSVAKTQKLKDSTLLPSPNMLRRKTSNQRGLGASTIDRRNLQEPQTGESSSLLGEASHFHYNFSQLPTRLDSPYPIQAKLKIGQPNDKYEQEADRVAEQVFIMPTPYPGKTATNFGHSDVTQLQRLGIERDDDCQEQDGRGNEKLQLKPLVEQITPLVQRRVETQEEKKEEEEMLQAKGTSHETSEVTTSLESRIQSLRGSGRPLSTSSRAFFEPRFGYDFSQVRIHNDARSAEVAHGINAKAFTLGQDVIFGAGQYSPGNASGRQLLAHELTHVIQQQDSDLMLMRYATGQAAIDAHTSGEGGCSSSDLDEEDLGRELAGLAMDPARHHVIHEAFDLLEEGVCDNVAGYMISALSEDQIREIGMTDSGRILLYAVQNHLRGGTWITAEETRQAQQIEDIMEVLTWPQVETVEPNASLSPKAIQLKIVKYHGCTLNTDNFVRRAHDIFSQQCNINVSHTEITVNLEDTSSELRMFLGTEDLLDLDVRGETYEGDAVRDRAQANAANQVPVAFVPGFADPFRLAEGFCPMAGYLVAVANRAQGVSTDILAHEIGHFYGLGHDNGNNRNLMAEGDVRERDNGRRLLSPWGCSRLRSQF